MRNVLCVHNIAEHKVSVTLDRTTLDFVYGRLELVKGTVRFDEGSVRQSGFQVVNKQTETLCHSLCIPEKCNQNYNMWFQQPLK